MSGHEQHLTEEEAAAMFEPSSWEERYSGEEQMWSGDPNPQLVAAVSGLNPQVDARTFAANGRSYDLVTTHYLHPPDGGMAEVTSRLADAVAPDGHLLVVGHAPSEVFTQLTASHRRAMFLAEDLLPSLPPDFEVVVAEQRPRTTTRDGVTVDVHDSALLARRKRR